MGLENGPVTYFLCDIPRITFTQTLATLSSQSEHQLNLIREITDSNRQHVRDQNEVTARVLSRFEQNERTVKGLQIANENLTSNQKRLDTDQQENKHDLRTLQAEVKTLKAQVQVLQQQQEKQKQQQQQQSASEVPENQEVISSDDEDGDDDEVAMPLPRGVTFTDVFGRRRRLCLNCGQNLGADYCIRHEQDKICLRPGYRARCLKE